MSFCFTEDLFFVLYSIQFCKLLSLNKINTPHTPTVFYRNL